MKLIGPTGNCAIQWIGYTCFDDILYGQMIYYVRINNPGICVFDWRTTINRGDSRVENTDTCLKIDGIKHFHEINEEDHKVKRRPFGKEGTEFEIPNKTEGPEGYMKIYGRLVKNIDWQSYTSDGKRHKIEVKVEKPGIITITIAGRSTHHAIDRFVLYKKDEVSSEQAKNIKMLLLKINYNSI